MQTPLWDDRKKEDLIRKMEEMVPHYTPEWRFTPDNPDAGTALFLLFADMFHGNVQRFNQLPRKYLISYLNLLNNSPMTAKPASVYLTFNVVTGATQSVWIPKGTQVVATQAQEEVLFETETNLWASPAQLTSIYSVSKRWDTITRHPVNRPFPMFESRQEKNLQKHCLYISHDDLLNLRSEAIIEIEFIPSVESYANKIDARRFSDPQLIQWSFQGERDWVPFDRIEAKDNRLWLTKGDGERIVQCEVGGATGRWIRCELAAGAKETAYFEESSIAGIGMNSSFTNGEKLDGRPPDMLFTNDIQIEPDGAYPFGKFFANHDSFYIASEDVLSKRGSIIKIQMDLLWKINRLVEQPQPEIEWKLIMKRSEIPKSRPPLYTAVKEVLWEYWNGKSWTKLSLAADGSGSFDLSGTMQGIVEFCCPEDLKATEVNSHFGYWIRVRILHIENMYGGDQVYLSPWLQKLTLTYAYKRSRMPEQVLTFNNLEWNAITEALQEPSATIRPFYSLEGEHPALYLGFDRPPVGGGPLNLYFSLEEQTNMQKPLTLKWECWVKTDKEARWAELKVIDGTGGFKENGIVQFFCPDSICSKNFFAESLYWIRASHVRAHPDNPGQSQPFVHRIQMNTVRAVQQETIWNEIPRKVTNDPPTFSLSRTPILDQEVWVDETGQLTEVQIKQLEQEGLSLRFHRDGEGQLQQVWVRWSPVENLHRSSPEDRHYCVDAVAGKIYFGDGKLGKALPLEIAERIKVTYKVGGGQRGNLEANRINHLGRAIPFIESVTNLEPSGGGCDRETLEDALQRGPQRIKHRHRAVAAEDFEWLVREAFPGIAKVKCLSHYNGEMNLEKGCITIVIFPKDEANMAAFSETKKQVLQYILERSPSHIAMAGKIDVIQPAYIQVSVSTVIRVEKLDDVVATEKEAQIRLSRFLHPLHGNFDGGGWFIGQGLYTSQLLTLLKSIRAVRNVDSLFMTVHKIGHGQLQEVRFHEIAKIPHGLIMSGSHKIVVKPLELRNKG
ncbi:putative baseplate assembly protein [Heliobacillus mobilis]|uniref:Putative baseplate assembly protein n=1 Tax=Heliobacterium mobile TaxID=28064 RepID=A0A6I3SPC1_HELMO|nr:putative baseplate assembly protein [Heliobacterium mobile]MTV50362.1 putative baseplate assembly protein [Heliobacterium mobile]